MAVGSTVLACSSPLDHDPAGRWGGEGASVNVIGAVAEFEFDCAHGRVDPFTVDAGGGFSFGGTYVREGGAEPIGGRIPITARYSGTVKGDLMTLQVLPDDSDAVSVKKLRRGADPLLRKCL